jgi:hypothetical protein
MATKNAGERAKGGFWFNTRTWEIQLHKNGGEVLPGAENDRYLRIPTVALLVLGPVMGFLFVIFLPAIGFALTFREIARRAKGLITGTARQKKEAKTAAR